MKKVINSKNIQFLRNSSNAVDPFAGFVTENKNSHILKELGRNREKQFSNYGNTPISRILLGIETKEEMNINYNDPKVLSDWIAMSAREGPNVLTPKNQKISPIVVTVTGAAGGIAYALLPRLCAGDAFGLDQPIILKLLDIESQLKKVEGVSMELQDCAFPLLHRIIVTCDTDEAFHQADYAFLIGSTPRKPGQERIDVLKENATIFKEQGSSLDRVATCDCLTVVVGNPANTNALILSANSPNSTPSNITAMTRLDHDRGLAQISKKAKVRISEIDRFCVWGNHSSTQYPDLSNTTIQGKWLRSVIPDEDWIYNQFIPTIQKRGQEILTARGKSSQQSAANSAINHMRDWVFGTNKWVSMAIRSTNYGVDSDIFSSFPVFCTGSGKYQVVQDIKIDEKSANYINASLKELYQEKEAVSSLFPPTSFKFVTYKPTDIYNWKYLMPIASKDIHSALINNDTLFNEVKGHVMKEFPDWKTITNQQLTEAFQKIDPSQFQIEQDREIILEAIHTSLLNDLEITKRKTKILELDLYDIEYFKDERFPHYPVELQKKYLQNRLLSDDSLTNQGFDGVSKINVEIDAALERKKTKSYYSEEGYHQRVRIVDTFQAFQKSFLDSYEKGMK